MNFKEFCEHLESEIQAAYLDGVSLEKAERLATEFLSAQLRVSSTLKNADLDARMKKSGLKAVKAAAYMSEISKHDKKPTEATISAAIDTNSVVSSEQDKFDTAEVNRDELERYYQIFREAHIHFRGVAKGRFD